MVEGFLDRLSHVTIDIEHEEGWPELQALLHGSDRVRVFYLAIAPALFGPVSHRLAEFGLVTPNSRLVLEKPIGRDLASAQKINDAVGEVFEEHQIFRIDHYLGKESVAEPARHPLRQLLPRAAVERQLHRPRADHRLRGDRRRQPRRLLRRLPVPCAT